MNKERKKRMGKEEVLDYIRQVILDDTAPNAKVDVEGVLAYVRHNNPVKQIQVAQALIEYGFKSLKFYSTCADDIRTGKARFEAGLKKECEVFKGGTKLLADYCLEVAKSVDYDKTVQSFKDFVKKEKKNE